MANDAAIIKVGDEEHRVELRPINIVCTAPNLAMGPPLEYPGRVKIDPEMTMHHARRVQKLDNQFWNIWHMFHKHVNNDHPYDPNRTADDIRKMSDAAVHLMGLIDLTLKFVGYYGMPVVWVKPETYLHPAWQVGLADLAIYFAKEFGGTTTTQEKPKEE